MSRPTPTMRDAQIEACPREGRAHLGAPGDELAYRLRQQEILSGFALVALRAQTEEEVQDAAVRHAAEGLRVGFAKYLSHREREGDLLLVAGTGWRHDVIGQRSFRCDMDSPAGYAFLTERPVLSNHLHDEGRFRTPTLLVEHGVTRALNVPVRDGGRPFGVLEADACDPGAFTEADLAFLQGLANVLSTGIARLQRHAEAERAHRREALLAAELRHRIRNLLTLARSTVRMSVAEAAASGADAGALVAGRIDALAIATETGLPIPGAPVGAGDFGDPVDPVMLTERILAPHPGARVSGTADLPRVDRGEATPLALLLHELATNAAKHGALSSPGGRVDARWSATPTVLRLDWRETGVPLRDGADARPRGFGQTMLDRASRSLGAGIRREWRADGLVLQLDVPRPMP